MMEGMWGMFCGNYDGPNEVGNTCSTGLLAIINPSSCINHVLVISVDILLLLILTCILLSKQPLNKKIASSHFQCYLSLPIFSAIFNGGLGLGYLGLGIWLIQEKLTSDQSITPLHGWLVVLLQGLTWLLLALTVYLKRRQCQPITVEKLCSIFIFLFTLFLCIPSLWAVMVDKEVSLKKFLDIFIFPGAILFLFCAFRQQKFLEAKTEALYSSLQGKEDEDKNEMDMDENVTPFATTGFLSRMSFWWFNPLIMKGNKKILNDKDIPTLRQEDRAEVCCTMFMKKLTKQKEKGSSDSPSILSTIFFWQWKPILVSGFFALIKVLALATGPLLLKAFIRVAEGQEAFKHEGYALAVGLLLAKSLESLSQRQWYFRTRLIGLQVRSMLSAAIYRKQLRLSNAGKATHSSGQIMNYVTLDAYKIGEFPYWLHQIWTTILEILLALAIIYYTIGMATFAALFVIVLTVIGNSPVAKLQHKYLSKLMAEQDKRLKAISEALSNMKVLKLYAWETHFKDIYRSIKEIRT